MQPSEFWELSPTEFWWEFDAKVRSQRRMSEPPKLRSKFSPAEWEAARRKFRERENGG